MTTNPRQALLDALTAERFALYVPPERAPVTACEAAGHTHDLMREVEDGDRYDRPLRLVSGIEEAS